ncbi:MAG: MBG domain-containing protein, partial [Bacteroidota bacterium]
INPAAATILVNGYEGTYDGAAHGATLVSATGVNSENLASSVTVATTTYTNVPGGKVAWSFENNNYVSQSGEVDIVINPAAATILVNGYEGTYDGAAHGATLVSATGVNSENLASSVTVATTTYTNVPGGKVAWSFENNNYVSQSGEVDIVINPAAATILVNGYEGTYDGAAHGATLVSATGVNSENLASSVTIATTTYTNVPGGKVAWSFENNNYVSQSGEVDIVINKRPITIIADVKSKYCGQADPEFTYQITSGYLVGSDKFSGSLAREEGEIAGTSYAIQRGTVTLSVNYELTYVGAYLTINGVTIDASASSTPVPVGSSATLSASVAPAVAGVSVTFNVFNEANVSIFEVTVVTNTSGVATATVSSEVIELMAVYKVIATAGSGCDISTAYIPVFDANSNFVTGGGWIESPSVENVEYMFTSGKANFGFVSKYKKGSSQVDGNTEFQFSAGGLNFKSNTHEAGSLVISGSRATYRGTGTVNGQSGYKFVVVAIDGQWNNQTNPDRFRIKITRTADDVVVYDNQYDSDENTTDATMLGDNGKGGGSIVIHEVKAPGKKSAEIEVQSGNVADASLKAYPNPFSDRVYFDLQWNRDGHALLEIFDARGAKVSTLYNNRVEAGEQYRIEYAPTNVVPGMMMYRLVVDGEVINGKILYQKMR